MVGHVGLQCRSSPMIDNIAGNPTRAKIEATSQAIIKNLERKAGCHWRTCCKKPNWNLLFLDWRLGWLAHQENETEPSVSSNQSLLNRHSVAANPQALSISRCAFPPVQCRKGRDIEVARKRSCVWDHSSSSVAAHLIAGSLSIYVFSSP